VCLSNYKQIGLSFLMYTNDYDETLPDAAANWWAGADFCGGNGTTDHYVVTWHNPAFNDRTNYSAACSLTATNNRAADAVGAGFNRESWLWVVYPYYKNSGITHCPSLGAADTKAVSGTCLVDWWSLLMGDVHDNLPSTYWGKKASSYMIYDMFVSSLGLSGLTADGSDVGGRPLASFSQPASKVLLYEDEFNAHEDQDDPSCTDSANFNVHASNMVTYVDGHAKFLKSTCLDQLLKIYFTAR